MTVTSSITRGYLGRAVRQQLMHEYSQWKRSGDTLGAYVQGRASEVSQAPGVSSIGDLMTGLRHEWEIRRDDDAPRDPRRLEQLAERRLEEAEVASRRLEQLREAESQLPEHHDALDSIRTSTEQHAAELTEQARGEAERRRAQARARFDEIERLAQHHVDQVEKSAHATANAIVAANEARLAKREAWLRAELERATKLAEAAEQRADVARRRADEAVEREHEAAMSDDADAVVDDQSIVDLLRDWLVRAALDQGDDNSQKSPTTTGAALSFDREALQSLDRAELYAIARRIDLQGRSSMSKSELLTAIDEYGGESGLR